MLAAPPPESEWLFLGGAEVPFSSRGAVEAAIPVMSGMYGTAVRDGSAHVRYVLVQGPGLLLRGRLGASVPLGGVNPGMDMGAERATGSLDPRVGVEVVAGRDWLVLAGASAVVPVYEGADGTRQGPAFAGQAVLARRLGARAVASAGAAGLRIAPSMSHMPDAGYSELAATAGLVWNVSRRVALSSSARFPVWQEPGDYSLLVGLGATAVLGKPPG